MNYTSISNEIGGIGQGREIIFNFGFGMFDFGICLNLDFYDLLDYRICLNRNSLYSASLESWVRDWRLVLFV